MSAVISECGQYRYVLHREVRCVLRWNKPALFVMLNPSTADAVENDPTIEKCIKYAEREQCTSLTVVNLFALRSKDPKALKTHLDPIGPDNNKHLIEQFNRCRYGLTIAAWGNWGTMWGRGADVRSMAAGVGLALQAIAITKKDQPIHPLYQLDEAPFYDLSTLKYVPMRTKKRREKHAARDNAGEK